MKRILDEFSKGKEQESYKESRNETLEKFI